MTEIHAAQFPHHLAAVQAIFREYAESLGIDLSFQNFDAELADLPGKYTAPRGCVLLAWRDGEVIGSVAMRPLDDTVC
jgi:predicted N-acetyltransferase YhbS